MSVVLEPSACPRPVSSNFESILGIVLHKENGLLLR